jgi:hypothetical protein
MWCFKTKVNAPGDFSFVSNRTLQFSLEYDYHACMKHMSEDPETLRDKACPFHSDKSYARNMEIMRFISKHSWGEFLDNKDLIASVSGSEVPTF